LTIDELPDRRIRLFWSILLIVMPIALLFARGSLENIQSVCIIAAFPLSIVLILCVAAFFKEGFAYVKAPPESATEQIPAKDPE
jgi:BCCT family betaine/carnitine transporter